MKPLFKENPLDFVGISASLICGIHCAALPFIMVLTPLAGLRFLAEPWIEYSVIAGSFIIAMFSLIHGYRRHHHRPLPLRIAGLGFLLIGIGHLFHGKGLEHALVAIGALLVALAHYINWRYI